MLTLAWAVVAPCRGVEATPLSAGLAAPSEAARSSVAAPPRQKLAHNVWFWAFLGLGALSPPALLAVAYWRRGKQDELAPEVLEALETTKQGLMVVDARGQIMFANRAFSSAVGEATEKLKAGLAAEPAVGGEGSAVEDASEGDEFALASAWALETESLVNHVGSPRGKTDLVRMLRGLRESRERIRSQIKELRKLANRDSLTGCLTRRAFFEEFDRTWHGNQHRHVNASCILLDIDHFRDVNTNHGHPVGDVVLAGVAKLLLENVRGEDSVCRYGGEEFAVLLPNSSVEEAVEVGERLREVVEQARHNGVKVTISVGVAHSSGGALDPGMLIEQADQCLYASKRRGRNTLVHWDDLDLLGEVPEEAHDQANHDEDQLSSLTFEISRSVPFQAVSGLLSALSYRDPYTAAHCMRVAELAVMTARSLMTAGELYFVESAALLHDIGKIGVPDSILLKPGPLATDEKKLMDEHARMGAGIVDAAFSCSEISEIIRHCKERYDAGEKSGAPRGDRTPLASRIIAVADAYDSMTHDWSYRDALSPEEAADELRRCAGRQFDPQIVEKLLAVLDERSEIESQPTAGGIEQSVLLNVGVMTERLAKAFDEHDMNAIRGYGGRLLQTARKNNLQDLVQAAQRLVDHAAADGELTAMLEAMYAIMDLSRTAQRAAIAASVRPAMDMKQ